MRPLPSQTFHFSCLAVLFALYVCVLHRTVLPCCILWKWSYASFMSILASMCLHPSTQPFMTTAHSSVTSAMWCSYAGKKQSLCQLDEVWNVYLGRSWAPSFHDGQILQLQAQTGAMIYTCMSILVGFGRSGVITSRAQFHPKMWYNDCKSNRWQKSYRHINDVILSKHCNEYLEYSKAVCAPIKYFS